MNNRVPKRLADRVRHRLVVRLVTIGVALAIAMVTGAATFVFWGAYNVSALQQHTEPVYTLLSTALDRSIYQRAEDIEVPPLDDPAMAERGLRHYQEKCVQCHGAPGIGRDDVGKGMTPVPPNLAHTAKAKSPAELFWPIKHGIKMTGMPSWQFIFTDTEIWELVAFLSQMPMLSPAEYQAWVSEVKKASTSAASPVSAPDPERGRLAMYGYACIACHRIPGLVGPQADVGPPLEGIGERRYIAGVLANNFDNMVHWLQHPTEVDPLTAMPDLGVTEQDAMNIAAYLSLLD